LPILHSFEAYIFHKDLGTDAVTRASRKYIIAFKHLAFLVFDEAITLRNGSHKWI
jgi:hypothetical protein